jgi:5'-3' exonuclease
MGIKGLSKFIKTKAISRPVSAATVVADRPAVWGVDCEYFLYKAQAAGLSPLTVIASLIVRIRQLGAEPIVIFDGSPSKAKTAVVTQRQAARAAVRARTEEIRTELTTIPTLSEAERGAREVEIAELRATAPTVSRADRNQVKQFLYAAGVLGVTAEEEADDLLGFLARRGDIAAVVSADFDMLARGVPRLIVPETADATVLTQIDLADILRTQRITYEQFVEACVLMGSDYSPAGWTGLYPTVALHTIRGAAGWLADIDDADVRAGLEAAAALLRGDGVEWGSALLDERQMEKWVAGAPAKEPGPMASFFAENRWPLTWRPALC